MEPRLPAPQGAFATRAVRASLTVPDVRQRPLSPAIWPTTTWAVDDADELGDLLEDRRDGYVYGRYDNPTATTLHTAIASLHGAPAAWSHASGTAAIHALLEATRAGGRIVATDRIYGGTLTLLRRLARDAGWAVTHLDLSDVGRLAAELPEDTTVLYAETIANPSTSVLDLAALAALCRERGIAFLVDNTFASPYLCRPLELGATAVVESATKYLGGHADLVAGVVAGPEDVVGDARRATYEFGGSLGPFEAWLLVRGIQTLHLRVREASRNAAAVADLLAGADGISAVRYPGLPDHPDHRLAAEQFGGRGFGGMLSFDAGSRERARAFAAACRIFQRAVSLGGTHSLVLHPGSTSHRQLTDDELRAGGVAPGTVRLSVGIEDPDDLCEDVANALSAMQAG
ncbi:MAG: aminotransferase class I/II-fold pyridoxal phosphate-dependent enzyme [Actinobacteria bacterium]|nr:aminotransferase class I/II-fold pyridoxal phosphate-dependent enzyme [Actinomycetota bacterium]